MHRGIDLNPDPSPGERGKPLLTDDDNCAVVTSGYVIARRIVRVYM
jgi:hypothetical protein